MQTIIILISIILLLQVDSMKWFVNRMHSKGEKVKIYYTIRELTNYTTEIMGTSQPG